MANGVPAYLRMGLDAACKALAFGGVQEPLQNLSFYDGDWWATGVAQVDANFSQGSVPRTLRVRVLLRQVADGTFERWIPYTAITLNNPVVKWSFTKEGKIDKQHGQLPFTKF